MNVSINATSASALALLTGTSKGLEATQTKVASGHRINEARDNAAYWSIATTMKAHNLSLSSAEDATGISAAIADTAALGLQAATDIVSEIQSKLVMAKAIGSNKGAINDEITQLKAQLGTVAASSSFNGQNWLKTDAGQQPKVTSMVASVTSNADGDLNVNVIDFDTAASNLVAGGSAADGLLTRSYSGTSSDGSSYEYFLLDAGSTTPPPSTAKEIALSDDATSSSDIDGMISSVNAMLSGLTNAGAAVGATSSRIAAGTEFLKDLQDVNALSIGRLVDADMGEESTRLKAQQAQQLLQTQGLNIANYQQKSVLSLFV